MENGKFEPARDETGRAVEGNWRGAITWRDPYPYARDPIPANDTGEWMRAWNWPLGAQWFDINRSMRMGVFVNADGSPSDCIILETSNYRAWDEAMCNGILENARYVAATNAEGEHVPGWVRVQYIFPE